MTHEQALDSAVEAFEAAMSRSFSGVGSIHDKLVADFKEALEHYRVARGEGDG